MPYNVLSASVVLPILGSYHRQLTRSATTPPTMYEHPYLFFQIGSRLTYGTTAASTSRNYDVNDTLPDPSFSKWYDIAHQDRDDRRHATTANACKCLKLILAFFSQYIFGMFYPCCNKLVQVPR